MVSRVRSKLPSSIDNGGVQRQPGNHVLGVSAYSDRAKRVEAETAFKGTQRV